jgi:hypothetical protein
VIGRKEIEWEGKMKSFLWSLVAIVVLAIGFAVVLNSVQKTAEAEFHTISARP